MRRHQWNLKDEQHADLMTYLAGIDKFTLSHRDIEDLLTGRGITVSSETTRLWCIKFGARYAQRLERKHQGYGDTFYIDEVFVKINGKQHDLWRAVDQDGELADVYMQTKRGGAAAKRFFERLIQSHKGEPRKIVTDRLRSHGAAHREVIPEAIHDTSQCANNRAAQSHELTRERERGMRKFKSVAQAQRFLGAHCAVSNLFNLGRHLVSANHYRILWEGAFNELNSAVT
jgi:putative transposase